jgi:hypothetical protein
MEAIMSLFPVSPESQAYADGYRAGQLDRQIGRKLEVSFTAANSQNVYVRNYGLGYRNGFLGVKF